MKYLPYPAYKDSGIPWLGKIPENWQVKKLKQIASVKFSNVDKKSTEGQQKVRLCNYIDVYYNDFINEKINFMEATASLDEISKFSLKKDDVLITKDSESWDDIAVASYVILNLDNVLCGYHLAHIRPNNKLVDGKYLFRSFCSRGINDQYRVEATGITRYGLSKYCIDNSFIIIPPNREQKEIANFLDGETGKIDALVEKKERQIELLQEKRSALISRAVTRGLDPHVPLKDAGIPWLGKIPKHWQVLSIRRIILAGSKGIKIGPFGSSLKLDMMQESGYKVYGQENIISGDFSKGNRYLSDEKYKELEVYSIHSGDILITMMGSSGYSKVFSSNLEQGIMDSHLLKLRIKEEKIIPNYLSLLIDQAKYIKYQMSIMGKGTIMHGLNSSIVKEIILLIPPLSEQNKILDFLDGETGKIDALVEKIKKSIELLKERRAALISAAVTGKIRVYS